jgi:hypothetical protein
VLAHCCCALLLPCRYTAYPFAPRIYCHPTPEGRAEWESPIKGECVAFCPGVPPQVDGGSWPGNCNNALIEGTLESNFPWAPKPHSTCTGSCNDG